MIALLDVNVLVALFDPMHVHHELAHDWFAGSRDAGWATCSTTENGFLRVVTNPSYPGRGTTLRDAFRLLAEFRGSGNHTFWPETISICNTDLVRPSHIQGHRQLTDVYLLAVAVRQEGRLATFDRSIAIRAVSGAESRHLAVLGT